MRREFWSNVDGDYVTHILAVSFSFLYFFKIKIWFGLRTRLEMSSSPLLLSLNLPVPNFLLLLPHHLSSCLRLLLLLGGR